MKYEYWRAMSLLSWSVLILALVAAIALWTWRGRLKAEARLLRTDRRSVRDLLRVLFRRKWAWLLPIVLGVLAAEAVWLAKPYLQQWLPARYRAEAIVLRRDLAAMGQAPGSLISPASARATLEVIRQELLMANALRAVITTVEKAKRDRWKEAGYPPDYPQDRLPADVENWGSEDPRWQDRYREVRGAVTMQQIVQRRGIGLVKIQVQHSDPWQAAVLANALADQYVETCKETLKADSRYTLGFYKDGRDEALKKLQDVEAQLDEYREDFYVDLPDVKLKTWGQLLKLRTEQGVCDGMLDQIAARRAEIDQQIENEPPTFEEETRIPNPKAVILRDKINQQQERIATLLVRGPADGNGVKEARAAIDRLRKELETEEPMVEGAKVQKPNPTYEKLLQARLDLDRQRRAQEAAKLSALERIAATSAQLQEIGEKEKTYYDLQRERREANELYQVYRKQLVGAQTRAEAEDNETGTQVEKVQPAVEPALATRQPYKKGMATLMMAGVACAIGLVFGLEFLDQTLRNREDAESLLKETGVPVLASIPAIRSPAAEARRRLMRRFGAVAALAVILTAGILAADKEFNLDLRAKIGSGVQQAASKLGISTNMDSGVVTIILGAIVLGVVVAAVVYLAAVARRSNARQEKVEPRPAGAAPSEVDATAVMLDESAGDAANQFRVLRARLLAIDNGEPPRVLTISSANSREGKSTLALNLAIALAQVERRPVVLVDGDACGGGLSELAGIQATTGLADVLAGDLRLNGNVYSTSVEGLDIIPMALPPDDGHSDAALKNEFERNVRWFDRLLSQQCEGLVAKLRELYAFVIIDTPAALASNHATVFGKHSDGVILVTRLEHTRRQVVRRTCQELRDAGAKILGCVLTDRKDHVPEFVYRLFSPPRYSGYGRYSSYGSYVRGTSGPRAEEGEDGEAPEAAPEPED